MADAQKALQELEKSTQEFDAKWKAYVEALDRMKDVQKAIKDLESAIADTTSKLDAAKKALEDFVKANKVEIEKSKEKKEALKAIYQNFKITEEALKKAQLHINRQRA